MGIEYELKYSAAPQTQAQLEQAFPGPWQKISMETTYYDTPAQALAARKITLRRRLEYGRSVCTLKTPTGDWGRGEWELEADSIEAALPELCKLSGDPTLGELTAAGVTPICGARFTRRACTVDTGMAVVELALDGGVLFACGNEAPLCEVEVELKSGQPEQALAFAQLLAKKYGLQAEHKSKFSRALALRKENENA